MFKSTMRFIEQFNEYPHRETFMHCLYLVKDGDSPLYAGKSYDPIRRLRQHLGLSTDFGNTSRDAFGLLYFGEKPESLEWIVEIYTVEDCLEVVRKHFISQIPFYTEEIYLSPRGFEGAIDFAEQSLIREHRPCLNVIYNREPKALPQHYRTDTGKPRPFKAGMKVSFLSGWFGVGRTLNRPTLNRHREHA